MTANAIPDAERIIRDELAELIDDDVTIGVGVPINWKTTSKPHIQVSVDNVGMNKYPVAVEATTRIVAWSNSRTTSKELAAKAQALLIEPRIDSVLSTVQPLSGAPTARDEETKAELALVMLNITLRTTSL